MLGDERVELVHAYTMFARARAAHLDRPEADATGEPFGPLALAWIASYYGGWGATLWAMLAFAAGGALCGFALARIERDKMAR